MKYLKLLSHNILFVFVLFFLAFIPLYPKLPLFGVNHTWVYIRLEDFIVAAAVLILGTLILRKKAPYKTPLTIPIVIFWAVGGVSTVFAILFLFPHLANVFPNVAFFTYLRHIEYLSLFFVSYAALVMKAHDEEKEPFIHGSMPLILGIRILSFLYFVLFILKFLAAVKPFSLLFTLVSPVYQTVLFQQHVGYVLFCVSYVVFLATLFRKKVTLITAELSVTMLLIFGYGIGQRLYGFPAYLTMNEEFAKGIPLKLSAAARIPSTFAGHYDLAAYLILLIPLMGSMIFGYKNIFAKIFLFLTAASGLILLLMTASRVSFVVYLAAVSFMLLLQKKKLFIIPVIILSIFVLQTSKGTAERFSNTISQVDLVVDARTGKAIGIAKQVPVAATATKVASKKIVIEDVQSTGENLPQGSGYINLPVTSSTKTISQVEYKRSLIRAGSRAAEVTNIQGDFAIKKVLAYDVSFTTRFQGEWPRAMQAFERNILLGSGYSSISLASDNNYIRMLGEIGGIGVFSFLLLFLVIGIYAYRIVPYVENKPAKSLAIGILAGIFGLGLNAVLIDVFEASKVAFVLWVLIGLVLGILHSYKKRTIPYVDDLKNVLTSLPAVAAYLIIGAFGVFANSISNYFVADDFTWLRWVADCRKIPTPDGIGKCEPVKTTIMNYFLHSDGFFYRPGMKLYFFLMYSLFWINQQAYHVASIFLHFIAATCIYYIGDKIFKNRLFGLLLAVLFLVLSSHSETIFWISSIGHILASVSILLGVAFFLFWKEKRNIFLLILSILFITIAPYFHEMGIVGPCIIILFDLIYSKKHELKNIATKWYYAFYLFPLPVYFILRIFSKSQWFSGDYSYKISNLPFNIVGNSLGYIGLTLYGNGFLRPYETLRAYGRENMLIIAGIIISVLVLCVLFYYFFAKKIKSHDLRIILTGFIFFFVPLLPFLGLGNIAIRYVYLASFGVLILLVFLIQKTYLLIAKANKYLADVLLVVFVIIFSYINISGLFASNKDWKSAGEMTNRLMVNFNDVFTTTPVKANPVFYFVNVPQKRGEAWIFPVGLKDAMWLTFQNENLTVETPPTLDLAFQFAEGSASAKVFQFDNQGNVEEIIKTFKIKNAK